MATFKESETYDILTAHCVLHHQNGKPAILGHTIARDVVLQRWYDNINFKTNTVPPFPSNVRYDDYDGTETSIPHMHLTAIRDNIKMIRDHLHKMHKTDQDTPATITLHIITPVKIVFDRCQELNNILMAQWFNTMSPFYDHTDATSGNDILPKSYVKSRDVLADIIDYAMDIQMLTKPGDQGVYLIPRLKGKHPQKQDDSSDSNHTFLPTIHQFVMAQYLYISTIREQKSNLGLGDTDKIDKSMFGKNYKVINNTPDNLVKLSQKQVK